MNKHLPIPVGSSDILSKVCFFLLLFLLVGGVSALQVEQAFSAEGIPISGEKSPAAPDKFIRIKLDDRQRPLSMQVAIVRFVSPDPDSSLQYVDLVSAVHIGEHSYYEMLNTLFAGYDAVLYELVAPEGTRIPRGGHKRKSMISGLQSWMRDVLDMGMQLEDVDYTAQNLVHADLSPKEFGHSMKTRNESIAGMIGKVWVAGMGQQYSSSAAFSEMRLLKNLLSGNRDRALKIFTAEQMLQSIRLGDVIEGPEGSTLVGERNKKVLRVLAREIGAGKESLAIFYGAAHMKDMSRRLMSEFGFIPVKTSWVDAWNLR